MNKYLGIDILKMWMVIYTHKTDIYPPNFKPGPSEKQQRNAMQLSSKCHATFSLGSTALHT